MKVLGIDLGMTKGNPAGFALLETQPELKLLHIWESEPVVKKGDKNDWLNRVDAFCGTLNMYLAANKGIELLAYEMPPYVNNKQVYLKLGHLGGIIRGVGLLSSIPVVSTSAIEVKLALTGKAKASKDDMIYQCKVLFGSDITITKDEADAVGAALAGEAAFREARIST